MSTKLSFVPMLAVSCLLCGCYDPVRAKQERWHKSVNTGDLAAALVARPGVPLLVEEQVLALIGREPDLRVKPIEFAELVSKDDPWRSRIMTDIWKDYCRDMRDLGESDYDARVDRWQDYEEFKQATLLVYDESYHFDKPLYHGDWLHCLFCGRDTSFTTHFFFVRQGEVWGTGITGHDLPLRRPGDQ